MKKIVFTLCALAVLATQFDFQRGKVEGCPFCDGKILETHVFYRGEDALGLITHKPVAQGHVLIIPKRHVERFEDLTQEEISAVGKAIQKVDKIVKRAFGERDYLLLQKNGRGAGQSVSHVHFHYLPARKFLAFHFFLAPWLKPLNEKEMEIYTNALKIGDY